MKPTPIIILLLLFVCVACNKKTVPPPEEDELYRVECFLQQKPDSAMQILDTLDVSALSEKEQAHYCLLRALLVNNKKRYGAELDSLAQVARNQFIGGDDKYVALCRRCWRNRSIESTSRNAIKFEDE